MERVDEDVVLPPAESLAEAQRLLDGGFPFHAHEVLEGAWKSGPDDERPFWQGLAQLAVGLTHAQRGNRRGAVSLLRRGADNVADGARWPAGTASTPRAWRRGRAPGPTPPRPAASSGRDRPPRLRR